MRVSNTCECFINDYTFPEMGFRKRVACGTVESLTRAGDPARDGRWRDPPRIRRIFRWRCDRCTRRSTFVLTVVLTDD